PFEGKCVIRIKDRRESILVRIPTWTDHNAVSCSVNGKKRDLRWHVAERDYLAVGPVAAGDRVEVAFPIKQWTTIAVLPVKCFGGEQAAGACTFSSEAGKKQECRIKMRANTVLDVEGDTGY